MITTTSLFAAEGTEPRALETLSQAIEKNNLPGFDYLEFKKAVTALAGSGQDTAMAFKSAFTTAATLGITKEKLLETAGYYKNMLQTQQEPFEDALQYQTDTKVTQPQSEVDRLRDQVARNKADIQRLEDEIAGFLTKIEQVEASIKTETDKISQAQKGFDSTLASMVQAIDKDIEAIHQYL
jgi:chromosome segregation ATPase